MAETLDRSIDLRHYWRVVWRRKWLLVLCTVATTCSALVALSFIPREYESSATLFVQDRQPLSRELEAIVSGVRGGGGGFRAERDRAAQIVSYVKSRPFVERLVKVLRMHEDPAILAAARNQVEPGSGLSPQEIALRMLVGGIQARIDVQTAGPGLYRFVVRDYDPKTAQLLAHWVAELYIDMTMQKELERLRQARKFGEDQLRVYEEQLRASEDALKRYQGSVIATELTTRLVREENLIAAESLQKRLADDAETAGARVNSFAREVSSMGLIADASLLRSDPQVAELAGEVADALSRVTEDELGSGNAEAIRTSRTTLSTKRTELYDELERQAALYYPSAGADARQTMATFVFATIDTDLQREEARSLNTQIASSKRNVSARPTDALELDRLQDEVNRNRELLQSFKNQMLASDLSQAIETTNLGMQIDRIEPAQIPLGPSYPDENKILVLALLMGPLIGVGFAFLSELLDPTLRALPDFQRVAPEPVLGTIPLLDHAVPKPMGFRRYWIPVTLIGVVLVTAGFFVARATVFPNLGAKSDTVTAVEPEEGLFR